MTDPGVIDTLQELQALIEADGGAFEMVRFDPSDGILRLRLVLDHVTCEECILPPEMLRELATDFVRRRAPQVALVEIDDPRPVGGA